MQIRAKLEARSSDWGGVEESRGGQIPNEELPLDRRT